MKTVRVEQNLIINAEGLHAAAAAVAPVSGVSAGPGWVAVHCEEDATEAQLAAVLSVIQNHDPQVLTSSQAEKAAKQQALAASRAAHPDELDPADYNGSSPLDMLAARVLWLEREIRQLRGI